MPHIVAFALNLALIGYFAYCVWYDQTQVALNHPG